MLRQPDDEEEAEDALRANYGLGRRLYEGAGAGRAAYCKKV